MEITLQQGTSDDMEHKRAYHHGDLPAQLLEAVRTLVEIHGPDGFSVAQAARQAGVSSAAPYKHFADRNEIMRALVLVSMDRLRQKMIDARDSHSAGSLEAMIAIGQCYIDFASAEPGVFRLMFGLTEGHRDNPEIMEKGDICFGVVIQSVASYLRCAADDPRAAQGAYMLWCFVHGHSFLTIDEKSELPKSEMTEHEMLRSVTLGILGPEQG